MKTATLLKLNTDRNDIEVFYMGSDPDQFAYFGGGIEPGWYWAAYGMPPAAGPFKTEYEASSNATWECLRHSRPID